MTGVLAGVMNEVAIFEQPITSIIHGGAAEQHLNHVISKW